MTAPRLTQRALRRLLKLPVRKMSSIAARGAGIKHHNTQWMPDVKKKRSCIPARWVCDRQKDCPHGEDEAEEECKGRFYALFLTHVR